MAGAEAPGSALRGPEGAGSSVRRALFAVAVAGTVLSLVLAAVTVHLARQADEAEALHRADHLVRTLASDVVGPRFDVSDPQGDVFLDRVLGSRARDGTLVRTKVWSPEGQVVWADDPRLLGRRYQLAPEDQALVGTTDAYAALTDLSKPENEYEQELEGSFIEVYAGFFDRGGRPLVFEAYLPAHDLGTGLVDADVLRVSVVWLVVLLAVLLPAAALLARRVDRAQARQQRLLRHAVEASELERRRLAQDLHDGVIQDLAGVAYAFSALEAQLSAQPDPLATARRAGEVVRRDVAALRALSTDLYPPDLGGDGLEAALEEMLAQCEQQGLCADLRVSDRLDVTPTTALVAYRVVREALRNVVKHAAATRVVVQVGCSDGGLLVEVEDDGAGFDPAGPAPEGHLGLRVLRDTVTDVHGELEVCSSPGGGGTRLRAHLPVR